MLVNLWVRDKETGHIHQVGTGEHDSIVFLFGQPQYYNLQNGCGTPGVYEWVKPDDIDGFISTGWQGRREAARAIFDDIRRLFCLAPKDGKIFAVWSPLCPDLMISAENGKEALEKAREVSDTYSQAWEVQNIASNAKRGVRLPMFNEFLELEKKYIPTMEDALDD